MQIVVTDRSHHAFSELLGLVHSQLPADMRYSLGAPVFGENENEWRYRKVAPLLFEKGLLFKTRGLVEDNENHIECYYFQVEIGVVGTCSTTADKLSA